MNKEEERFKYGGCPLAGLSRVGADLVGRAIRQMAPGKHRLASRCPVLDTTIFNFIKNNSLKTVRVGR